jgi:hypothetical protein
MNGVSSSRKAERNKRLGRERYRRYLAFFTRLKEVGRCAVCGISGRGQPEIMEFHHAFAPKEYHVNAGAMSHLGRKKILIEFMKCAQVCACCHRRLHAGTATLEKRRELEPCKFDRRG